MLQPGLREDFFLGGAVEALSALGKNLHAKVGCPFDPLFCDFVEISRGDESYVRLVDIDIVQEHIEGRYEYFAEASAFNELDRRLASLNARRWWLVKGDGDMMSCPSISWKNGGPGGISSYSARVIAGWAVDSMKKQ